MKKYFAEGALIVFSVLFALFINNLFADYQIKQKKKVALESIQKEISKNAVVLEKWKKHHRSIALNISTIVEGNNDSLKNQLENYTFINLGVLTNQQSLVDAILTNTAWESAKTTGIISEFDFETTQKLTTVYSVQEVLLEKSLINIINYYFDNAHDIQNLDKVLLQLQLRFNELTGQEELLSILYNDILKNRENKN